jgi:PAS domain S-box-containing protein
MSKPRSTSAQLSKLPALASDEYRLLVESVVDYAIFVLDPEGHIATWNLGAQAIKGYQASEIIGAHFSRFYPEEDLAAGKPQRELETAMSEGRVEDEGWRIRKDGSRFWASVIITALRDETGTLRGFGKVTRDLSARREAEERLRQVEQRFHLLIDGVVDYAIFMLDPTGHVSTWNEGAQRVKGYSAEQILGKHFSIFYTSADRVAGRPQAILEAVRREGRFEDESWRVRKDGSQIWANVVITALHDPRGELVGFAKVTRDLTARREAEEVQRRLEREQSAREAAEAAEQQLRASELRFRALSQRLEIVLEGVADGITVQDSSGRVVYANSAAAKICGFETGSELMSTPPAEVVARFEMLDAHGQPMAVESLPARRVFAGHGPSSALIHVRERATQRDWWVQLRGSAVVDAEGKPELAINIWHDITVERVQELQSKYLAEATATLGTSLIPDEMLATLARVLVPGLGDWCSIYLREGEGLRDVACAHADTAKRDAVEAYRARFSPDREHAGGVWSVLRSGASLVVNAITDDSLARSTQDPEAQAMLQALGMKAVLLAPIAVRGRVLGVIALVSVQARQRYDGSELALVEELGRRAGVALENAQLYASAQQAAQTAELASRAKDEFLATVSHELRTPLNAIVGWSSVLKSRALDASLVKPVEVIHRNALAQVKIIDDILDVSRVISGKLRIEARPSDLLAIAADAIEVVRPSAIAKRIEIELAPVADACLLVADPERLQQVVWNLLSNAVKFTDADGKVRVVVGHEGSQVSLSVSDTGRGIDPEFLPHVFERFRQADSTTTRRVGGLGLGLALARHIVELHGGRVFAESEGIGKGSKFKITLPIRAVIPALPEPEALRENAPTASPIAASLDDVRVLVVDDEPDARELIAAVLMQAGAIVETAGSAAEGFDAVQRFKPDVLVSDIGMPDEDGLSLVRRIRALGAAEGRSLPALALTAFARESDRNSAINAGYTTHIGKPVDPAALACAVANLASVSRRR